ncbi:hypothetical protein PEBR_24471 [Penicillium brasilianum]|uniref:Uncharacterized protein n=1 Tax=Penicillium brasilianum TaxID=104259 RepID=A0A1S9RKV5_PENBI|nr:hypothetical protein PEBR_24471 [Penicillium brasilianum]
MGSPSSRILLGFRRRLSYHAFERLSRRGLASVAFDADPPMEDPSPSQLLRYTLTSSNPLSTETENDTLLREQILSLIDTQWISGNPPPALWCALKGVHPTTRKEEAKRLHSVNDISSLRSVVERLAVDQQGVKLLNHYLFATGVLQRCEENNTYSELVSALSDIATRHVRLQLPRLNTDRGLDYAALDLSMPAFQHFLHNRQELYAPPLSFSNGGSVINALFESIESVLFERPNYDTSYVLASLTGEGERTPRDRPTLHDVLHESPGKDRRNWTTYLCVLARLYSRDALINSWKQYMADFDRRSRDSCHLAYNVILALVRSRRSDEAAVLLEDISQRSKDSLPHIATLRNAQALLDDPVVSEALPDLVKGHHYDELLETRLLDMESRLGIRWEGTQRQAKSKAHIGVTPDSPWKIFTDQPLLTIDGDCAGYEDPVRLWSEIRAHGCSKSRNNLLRIVDVLNEQDGTPQRVAVRPVGQDMQESFQSDFSSIEFQWNPEHSPLEFSESPLPAVSDRSAKCTPVTLGLLRARATVNGVPQDNNKCLHLIQLGSLDMRFGAEDSWLPSGYIVAWDRQYGEMIALYVGAGYGVIDRGSTPMDAPFGAIVHIRPVHVPHDESWHFDRYSRIPARSYYLDLDLSPDLGFC